MPRRDSHEQKSPADREKYWATTVRQKQAPTIAEPTEEFDSTETPLPPLPEKTISSRSARPHKRRFHWWRENWVSVLLGTVGTGVVSLVGWSLHQTYSLNREVGELRVKVDENTKQQEQFRGDFQRFEQEVRQELDRLSDQLLNRPNRVR